MIVAPNNGRSSSDDNFVIRVISVARREWLTTRIDSVENVGTGERERERERGMRAQDIRSWLVRVEKYIEEEEG